MAVAEIHYLGIGFAQDMKPIYHIIYIYNISCFMYGTSGVIHVWYIRCDSSGVIEMPPPASRQARPAIQQRGARR